MYDEDFYEEISEFEEQMNDLKASLQKNVKEKFVAEIERLRTENAELQKVQKDWKNIQSEYAEKHRKLEYERSDLVRKVRRERLNQLMQDFEIIMYTARSRSISKPKCENCDERRRIKFKTPSGKDSYEECVCAINSRIYEPEEFECTEFSLDRDGNKIVRYYSKRDYSEDGYKTSNVSADAIYQEGVKFEDLTDYWTVFFPVKDDCQRYCDWLNIKGKEASKHGSISHK